MKYLWILHHKIPDSMRNNWESQSLCSHHIALTLTQTAGLILWNNPTDCTLSQLKLAELCRLACPRSHPDGPNHCLTTCGTNSWTANKPYFTPAPHQPDHFYLWFHTFRKRAISAKFTVAANATGRQGYRSEYLLKNPIFYSPDEVIGPGAAFI